MGEAMPFAEGSFDGVFSAYVFRNLRSIPATLAEIELGDEARAERDEHPVETKGWQAVADALLGLRRCRADGLAQRRFDGAELATDRRGIAGRHERRRRQGQGDSREYCRGSRPRVGGHPSHQPPMNLGMRVEQRG